MNYKDNLLCALNNEECEKTPVVAFPTILTMELLMNAGTNFDEACHDGYKMAEVAGSVHEYTGIEAITVPLDLWFEAESFGYKVERENGKITPKVTKAPYATPEDIDIPDDYICKGQFPVIEEAISLLHERYDDREVPLIGEITGAFTLLTDLVDMGEIIKMLSTDYMIVDDALAEINELLIDEIKFYEECDVDCIVVNDPSSTARIIKPELYTSLIQPYLEELRDTMHTQSVLHICGDTNANLEQMLNTGYNGISISQEVDIADAVRLKEQTGSNTVICGNVAIGESLLWGGTTKVRQDSMDCLRKSVNILGPGCNIAYETPSVNIRAMKEARDEYYSQTENMKQ